MAEPAGPPPNVPSEVLFRELLAWRPRVEIDTPLGRASVVAITGVEELRAYDVAASVPEAIRRQRLQCGLIAACLRGADGKPIFNNAEDVGELYEDEIDHFANRVCGALDRICPTYARSDWRAWKSVLEGGARHPANGNTAWALAQCCDPMPGTQYAHPHPERYWNCAVGDLLDGHWMLFRAARALYG